MSQSQKLPTPRRIAEVEAERRAHLTADEIAWESLQRELTRVKFALAEAETKLALLRKKNDEEWQESKLQHKVDCLEDENEELREQIQKMHVALAWKPFPHRPAPPIYLYRVVCLSRNPLARFRMQISAEPRTEFGESVVAPNGETLVPTTVAIESDVDDFYRFDLTFRTVYVREAPVIQVCEDEWRACELLISCERLPVQELELCETFSPHRGQELNEKKEST